MASLSASEVRKYQDQGYVVPEFRLSDAWIKRMQSALNTLIANNPGKQLHPHLHEDRTGRNDFRVGHRGA